MGAARDVLDDIRLPGVELALWRRSLPFELTTWLDALPFSHLPRGNVLVAHDSLGEAISALVAPTAALAPAGQLLIRDIEELASRFLVLSQCALVDVRLEAVDDDACAGFHRDQLSLRLVTTYRGPGTQWVTPANAEVALRERQAYRGPLETFPDRAVGVFRGSRAKDAEGLTHRSPPIEGTGQTRLLLSLGPPTATSPEPWLTTCR